MELCATIDCKDVIISVVVCSEKLVKNKVSLLQKYHKLEQFHVPETSTY